jgi:CheY-like chemotaxis protein
VETDRITAKKRVLIVDDEKVITMTLAWIFKGKGYETATAYSAEEAMRLLGEWIPQLAILDVSLPGMNGVDLAIHIRGRCPDCQLLLISGKPDSMEALNRAEGNGHSLELMAKPVPPAVLLDRAAELLA